MRFEGWVAAVESTMSPSPEGGLDDAQPFIVGGSVGHIGVVGVNGRVCACVICGTTDVLKEVRVAPDELGQPSGRAADERDPVRRLAAPQ
jgi:hypothetical protein